MDEAKIKATLREEVRRILNKKQDVADFSNSESLVDGGRLESINVVEIATFVEDRFGLDFSVHLFNPDDFDSIDGIAAFIADAM